MKLKRITGFLLVLLLAGCMPAAYDTPPQGQLIPTTTAIPATATPEPAPTDQPAATLVPTATSVPNAANFPDPAAYEWKLITAGLVQPVDLADPNDGSGSLLILEQDGHIRRLLDSQLAAEAFLDLTDRVGTDGSERGLLGIALDPDYAANHSFYVNYTDKSGSSIIARFTAQPDGSRADPASEQILLTIRQPYANHNGGGMAFGPDGYLYLSLGDGGSGGDPKGNGQNTQTLLGKLLRIDVRGQPAYAIPADNPFAGGGGEPEIWALGLRNAWRFSFDRSTGDLYIADVGQNQWEELDFLPAGSPGGANFGWNYREAAHPFEGKVPQDLILIDPVWEYGHDQGCSITGGYVYRGTLLPEWQGIYLAGDYCRGRVWGLLRSPDGSWQASELFNLSEYISAFGQDANGELYLMGHTTGTLFQLVRR